MIKKKSINWDKVVSESKSEVQEVIELEKENIKKSIENGASLSAVVNVLNKTYGSSFTEREVFVPAHKKKEMKKPVISIEHIRKYVLDKE